MEALIAKVFSKYNYWVFILLMLIGFMSIIAKNNLIKKMIGLNIFQPHLPLFHSPGSGERGDGPHCSRNDPEGICVRLPPSHVLILTAIVVSVATTAVWPFPDTSG